MIVLQVIDNLSKGGAERVMVNLCNWLFDAGKNVEVVLISGKGQEFLNYLHPEIKVHILKRKDRFDVQAAYRFALLLKRSGIAHVHMRHNYRYTALIAKLCNIRTPLIFHDHYGKINLDESVPMGFKSFSSPVWYIGVSKTLVEWADAKLETPNDHIFLLENTVEARTVKMPKQKRDLILVSNIKPQKNQFFGLEILKQADWNLDFYGGRQDEKYTVSLEEQIRKLGLSHRVKIVSNCSDIQSQLSAYRLGLHLSNSETGPLAMIEYLAQGLPFLAYRTGAAAEKISRDFPEFFLDNFDIQAWIDRINLLMASPPDSKKMACVFEKYFSKSAYLEKCLKIYGSVLRY